MASNFETRLGELALARGVATVRDLITCSEAAADEERSLGELLVERRGISRQTVEDLERELREADPDTLSDAFERGETMVTQSIYTGTAQTLAESAQSPPNETVQLDADDVAELSEDTLDDAEVAPSLSCDADQRYEFRSELGRGGMGQVILARDRVMRRDIALKTVLPQGERPEHSRERLVHEARLTGVLEHPSIVPTYALGELGNGNPYYTMRVVREQSLQEVLNARREGRDDAHSMTQLVSFLRQVALAIQFAHDHGVIHRDIKPENILIGSYGEVFIIDWGVARVVDETLTPYSVDELLDLQEGAILGTPRYMPPEQARGHHEAVDERSDVYSLGAVLYEMLTLQPIFEADRTLMMLFKVVDQQPVAPSERVDPESVPRELEEICLKAVAKDPEARFQSAQELADELEMFLEGVKERERRHQMAVEAVEQAHQARERYEDVRARANRLQDELRQKKLETRAWAPTEKKEDLWELEQRVEDLQVDVERAFGEATKRYGQALGHEPDMPEARRAMASLYWDRFEEHEAAGERARAAYFESLVRQYNDGQYDALLEGNAALSLTTDPPGAEAVLCRYEEVNRRLVERRVEDLGETPVEPRKIKHGSYVIELDAPGKAPVQAPVDLGRLDRRELAVKLYDRSAIPEDFAIIPGGPYLSGEVDSDSRDSSRKALPDFAIKRHPVTCAEYLEFLNDLAARDMTLARKHAPSQGDKPSYFPITEEGRFVIPAEDQDGDAWHEQWPMVLVNTEDAAAYARWRSERDGFTYRLPTAAEWEKAARGVDGRLYPWGDHFDASFCNMDESSRGRSLPSPVGSFPIDRSPYGVMDMAGNVIEWTATRVSDDPQRRVLQGATFRSIGLMCRLDWPVEAQESERTSNYGFRLAMDLEG